MRLQPISAHNSSSEGAWLADLDAAFGEAVCVKLAQDGAWERALVVPLCSPTLPAQVERWMEFACLDVAIEVGFGSDAFIGFRLRPPERRHASRLLQELRSSLMAHLVGGAATLTAGDVLAAIDRAAGPRFAEQLPHHAEIGVLDHWRSLGSVRLSPHTGQELSTTIPDHLSESFTYRALPGPLMLEVAYGPSGDGWLAVPISSLPVEGPSFLEMDEQALERCARLLWRIPANVHPACRSRGAPEVPPQVKTSEQRQGRKR